MTLNVDLAKLGEPPATPEEEVLATFLAHVLDLMERGAAVSATARLADSPHLASQGEALVQTTTWLQQFAADLLEHSGALEENLADSETASGEGSTVLPTGEPLPDLPAEEFRLQAFLGKGAFGKVWLADDFNLGIPVALKTLHYAGRPEAAEQALTFLRHEAQILARLYHPNVIRVYNLQRIGTQHYLKLQYVTGGSLARRLEREGPLPWQQAARYIADVAEALEVVHARGLVHRDIKPANILWDPETDEAVLTDFGLAAHLADHHSLAGTPAYMSPEAFRGQATAASDVYSLAATLFALVTGQVPFPADSLEELQRRQVRGLPDPDPRCAGMPEPLERLIRSGLEAEPARRPRLPEFLAALRGSLNQLLADSLVLAPGTPRPAAPVELRLLVSRWDGRSTYTPLATTHPKPVQLTRDLKRVPPPPEQVRLRTGDRVRLQVTADRGGYLTVFNVGPTGHLNLLYPDTLSAGTTPALKAHQPLDILDIELTPPAGHERVFAVWSREPLPLSLGELASLAERGSEGVSRSYRATRDMKRVQESVQRLAPESWHAVVLELEHG